MGNVPLPIYHCQSDKNGGLVEELLTALIIPSLAPGTWAQGSIGQEELYHPSEDVHTTPSSFTYLTARCEVLALGYDALVVIDIVLPAMLGLILVREAGVEAYSSTVNWIQSSSEGT